jgi:glycosyltransferase involved in cell wall biosynthesis
LMVLANVPAFYYGTSPNKFFDYLASSLPILVNYPGWMAEMITREDAGVVVPPEDPVAFADALVQLADNKTLTVQMGRKGRGLAEREFVRENLAARCVLTMEKAAWRPSGK